MTVDLFKSLKSGYVLHPLLVLTVLGLAIRVPLSIVLTHSYDVYYWAVILENMESGSGLYGLTGYYYSPVWGYFMAVFSYIATAIFDIGTLAVQNDSLAFTDGISWEYYMDIIADPGYCFLYKMVLTIFDLCISLTLYSIVKEYTNDRKKSVTAFAMWWLCPLMIYTANIHVMFDSHPILITLLAVYFLLKERYLPAGIAFAIAGLEKMFPAYLLFIFVAYIIAKDKGQMKQSAKHIALAAAGAIGILLVILLPNILEGNVLSTLGFISNRLNEINSGDLINRIAGHWMLVVCGLIALAFIILAMVRFKKMKSDKKEKASRFMKKGLPILFLCFVVAALLILLKKASGEGELWDQLTSGGYMIVVIFQIIILPVEIYIACRMSKIRENIDLRFFHYLMLSATCIFLWTPTPTYLMLIIPFIILETQINDGDYKLSYYLLALFASCYAIVMQNYSDLFQLITYYDIAPTEFVTGGIHFLDSVTFSGLTYQNALNIIFGALETVAIYSVLATWYIKKRNGGKLCIKID